MRKTGNFYFPAKAKLAFVIRMRYQGVSPKILKALQLLHLCQIFNYIFVKFNKASVKMLMIVDSYGMWVPKTEVSK